MVVLGAKSNASRFWETRHLFNWMSTRTKALLEGDFQNHNSKKTSYQLTATVNRNWQLLHCSAASTAASSGSVTIESAYGSNGRDACRASSALM